MSKPHRVTGRVLGLTGPIAAGKNEIAKIMSRHGAHIIEADELGHKLLAPQSDIWCRVVKTFGSKVLNRGGVINRKKLGEQVFSDPKKMKKLNEIMHPPLKAAIKDEMGKAGSRFVVVNAALPHLFDKFADQTIVVMAPENVRLRRLMKGGMPRGVALARIKAQIEPEQYLKLADIVIENNGTKQALAKKIKALFKEG